MKVYKVSYLKPNPNWKPNQPLLVYCTATYHAESEDEAVARFHKLHDNKRLHQFQYVWEENPFDKLRKELGKKLLPRR